MKRFLLAVLFALTAAGPIPHGGGIAALAPGIFIQNADGSGKTLEANLQAAFNAVSSGQQVLICLSTAQAGTLNTNTVTIVGCHGCAPTDAAPTCQDQLTGAITADGKGTLVLNGSGITVQDLEISGAVQTLNGNGDNSTSAIRYSGANLTVQRVSLHDNTNGLLGANVPVGTLAMTSVYVNKNGDSSGPGLGQTHDVYIGDGTTTATISASQILRPGGGYTVKSRAQSTIITTSYIASLGSSAGDGRIDIPNGKQLSLSHSVFEQGPGGTISARFVRTNEESPTCTITASTSALTGCSNIIPAVGGAAVSDNLSLVPAGNNVTTFGGSTINFSGGAQPAGTGTTIVNFGTQSATLDHVTLINDEPNNVVVYENNSWLTASPVQVTNSSLINGGFTFGLSTGSPAATGSSNTQFASRSAFGLPAYSDSVSSLGSLP